VTEAETREQTLFPFWTLFTGWYWVPPPPVLSRIIKLRRNFNPSL
jgi:hypothetical protein